MNNVRLFNESSFEKAFLENGYVVVPFLSKEKVKALSDFYKSHQAAIDGQFQSTHFSKDREYKKKVHHTILKAAGEEIEKLLIDYRALFCNFMVKKTGGQSMMPLHADWTYVDEEKYVSMGIWCPLTDTNTLNGTLGVIPFSHRFKTNLRGPQIPSPFHDFNQYIIDRYGKLIPIHAGDAVIYNHRMLHFSPPNLSGDDRIAINIVIAPAGSKVFHYSIHDPNDNLIYSYKAASPEFFLEYDHFEKPDGQTPFDRNKLSLILYTKDYIDSTLKNESALQRIKDALFRKRVDLPT